MGPAQKEFYTNTILAANRNCFHWKSQDNREPGGGQIKVGEFEGQASEVGYRLFKGEIPSGKQPAPMCEMTWCCNPDHQMLAAASPAQAGAEPLPESLPKAKAPPTRLRRLDDLTAIKGIGPATADQFHGHGITCFAEIAEADYAEVKIGSERQFKAWQKEAAKLAAKLAKKAAKAKK